MFINLVSSRGVGLPIHRYMYFNRGIVTCLSLFMHGISIRPYSNAWRGIFQRDYFLRSCEVSFCSGCDRRNSFEREMIIGL